jgi:hypothetical protein
MRRFLNVILFLVLSAVLVLTVSCGGTSMSAQGRQLQSITVTPATADAKNSPNGMVQFSAMGNFNMAPMTAATPVTWSLGMPMASNPMMPMASTSAPMTVTISTAGVAQCNGFMGTVSVMATAPMDPSMPVSQMSNMTMNVTGMAQLTCP